MPRHERRAVPPMDAQIWVSGYRVGGGARGNVGAGTLVVPRTSIPGLEKQRMITPRQVGVSLSR